VTDTIRQDFKETGGPGRKHIRVLCRQRTLALMRGKGKVGKREFV